MTQEMTGEIKKRPLGIGKRKKQIASESTTSSDPGAPAASVAVDEDRAKRFKAESATKPDTPSLMLEFEGETEMEQLYFLYSQAIKQYQEMTSKDALPLLRACVHESDKILRIYYGEVPKDEQDCSVSSDAPQKVMLPEGDAMPARFYVIFGHSLCLLGEMETVELLDNDGGETIRREYLAAAMDRLETGFFHHKDGKDVDSIFLKLALGRVFIDQALLASEDDKESTLVKQAYDYISEFMENKSNKTNAFPQLELDVAIRVQNYAEQSVDEKWYSLAKSLWELVLSQDEDHVEALIGLGSLDLSLSEKLLDQQEENADDTAHVDSENLARHLESALAYLKAAREKATPAHLEYSSIMAMLGETLVHLGNLDTSDEEDDNAEPSPYYVEAVEIFKELRDSDESELPQEFADFLIEWEAEMA